MAKKQAKAKKVSHANGYVPRVWCQFNASEKEVDAMRRFMANHKIDTYPQLAKQAITKLVAR